MRDFTTKVTIESFFGQAHMDKSICARPKKCWLHIWINPYVQPTASESSKPQAQLDSTGRKKISGVCHVCLTNEFKKCRKIRKSCLICEFPICDEHCVSTTCEEHLK